MKKIVFLSLALLVCTLCSAKKPVKKQAQERNTQEIIDSLKNERDKHQAELDKLTEYRMAKEPHDMMYRIPEDMMYRKPVEEIRKEIRKEFPCMLESTDSFDYYGGYGVATGRNEQETTQVAINAAVADIKKRVQSSVQVIDSVTTIELIVRDSIDFSNVQVVCQKLYMQSDGMFKCYVAVHVPIVNNNNLNTEEIKISKEYLDSMKMELKAVLEEYSNGVSRNAKNE